MNCETARLLMEAGDPALDAHLLSCPVCMIGAHAPYYEAPPGLERRIRGTLRRESSMRSPWFWVAAAAALLLSASIAGNVALLRSRVDPRQALAANVLSAHVRSLAGMHLLDVPSADGHTVKPWFNGKLDFSPDVKEIDGFPLLGGRLEYFDGRPAAALIYGRRKHVVNLFTWPAADMAPDVVQSRNGFNLESWSAGGMTFWAVSDLNAAELRQFVSLYRGR